MTKSKNFGKIKCRVKNADGSIAQETDWIDNLMLDSGLNRLANGCGFANVFRQMAVGSSNSPNVIASGAITFTQLGTTVIASAGFFTASMTGAILKYGATGSAGAEVYLTYVSSTQATASVSMTVGTPTAATVYMVQQTALTAYSYTYDSYDTATGNCFSTFSATNTVQQRVFKFNSKVSVYTVNEVGYWGGGSSSASNLNGRIVLPVSLSVSPTQYLEITLQMTFTVSPNAPAAVVNVGTAVNTAGLAMCENWDCSKVLADGSSAGTFSGYGGALDGSSNIANYSFFFTTTPALTQNSTMLTSTKALPSGNIAIAAVTAPSNASQPVGVGVSAPAFSITTAGQVATGIVLCWGGLNNVAWDILFTSGQALPVGTLAGTATFQWQFTRQLVN